jgi:RNA polymerase sigma factor (TIGR02999 family)
LIDDTPGYYSRNEFREYGVTHRTKHLTVHPTHNPALTQILTDVESGRRPSEEILPLVYVELRKLAEFRMRQESPGQTLQATALVHEAWLRLQPDKSNANENAGWESRGHFFAAASEAMRRILVDHARHKQSVRHGGEFQRIELEAVELTLNAVPDEILALDAALDDFERVEPKKAKLVKLRYFAGLSEADAAEAMGISRATAVRYWAFARAWLFDRLKESSK